MHTDNSSLDGKTALVTGAARRIGAEIARTLHATGMNVVLHYRNSARQAQSLAAELEQRRGDSVSLAQGDLLDLEALPALVATAVEAHGRLDAIVNNASTFYPTAIGEVTEQHWKELMGTNLKGPFFLAQAAAGELKKNGGCIVNIVDIHAGRPLAGYPVYCIAKAGLAMMTLSLARELAPEVRVNGVAPGAILWPEPEAHEQAHREIIERTALKRQGSPKDIATTVKFLIADSPYITGQIVTVDGGRTLSN